jgi:hypothetical protein
MKVKTHIIDSGNNGYMGIIRQGIADKNILVIRHSAGFFSCSSIALLDILVYFNENKTMPDEVDRHAQYSWYKSDPNQSLIGHFFAETGDAIPYEVRTEMTYAREEPQFSNYSYINFEGVKPFVDKFFAPSQYILDKVAHLEEKYQIDYENTVGVLYRGNDKNRETKIGSYEEFSRKIRDKWLEFKPSEDTWPQADINKILVAPDETEFLEYLSGDFDDWLICMEETAHMSKKDSCIPLELPLSERAEQAANFFATVLMLSKCKHLITHSGNIGFWACLYRGSVKNVHQYLNGVWISH